MAAGNYFAPRSMSAPGAFSPNNDELTRILIANAGMASGGGVPALPAPPSYLTPGGGIGGGNSAAMAQPIPSNPGGVYPVPGPPPIGMSAGAAGGGEAPGFGAMAPARRGMFGAGPPVAMRQANGVDATLSGLGMSDTDIASGDPQAMSRLSLGADAVAGTSGPRGMFGVSRGASDMIADRRSFLSDATLAKPGKVKKAWDEPGGGRDKWQAIAAGLMALGGNQAGANALNQQIWARQREAQQRQWEQQEYDRRRGDMIADREWEMNKPQVFSGGQDRIQYDPRTGQTTTLYDAPTSAETYAAGLGYEPGSDEYRTAMQDYTLRGWSDTALANKQDLETTRYGYRRDLRGVPTYRDTHPRPAPPRAPRQPTVNNVIASLLQKQNSGQPLTPGEQQTLADYRSRSGGGSRGGGGGAAPVRVTTLAQAQALPPGTRFQTPDGRIKVR